jgi:hypothetical protein
VSHTCGRDYKNIHAGLAAQARAVAPVVSSAHLSRLKKILVGTVGIVSYLDVRGAQRSKRRTQS